MVWLPFDAERADNRRGCHIARTDYKQTITTRGHRQLRSTQRVSQRGRSMAGSNRP
ncbi:MAG: hypothetical protein AVDCRST_MAG33-1136 [uncultured Thermomicrobiales bacterium]|uniref:Uncharacterized protein n=1 Tax=uncultured Thermomicrobiales bacterium TaxID=1645740 RepID=A0A6J4UNM0_9BACT|nr:MAG: hypothetical protein AVDCRST_MAG33-1136 [uncultured Thermomicrobiales bacterium]